MIRGVVLIDGQHYPPVVERSMEQLSRQDINIVAAVFLGGSEKTDRPPDLAIPVIVGDPASSLREAIDSHAPDVVFDLSDEPVLDHRQRFGLVSVALHAGVAYQGAGYRFDPPSQPAVTDVPSVAVTGTGKRTGKTAVAIELARHWRDAGRRVAIVTMGRGGPSTPLVLRADDFEGSVATLMGLAEQGLHAASDYIEDAVFAGVDTVGTYRCGAGLSGETDQHNFLAGVEVALTMTPEVLIFEGSGTAIPPVKADAHVLVMPVDIDSEFLKGYLGPYRVRTATSAVIMDPALDRPALAAKVEAILTSVNPDLAIFRSGYRLEPSVPVDGKRVLLTTTAPVTAAHHLTTDLKALGAASVQIVHSLSDRSQLSQALTSADTVDIVLAEVKAAAVDVVLPWASAHGVEAGLIHNQVMCAGGTGGLAESVSRSWNR